MVTNKVMLTYQRDYFDFAPCVIIVPILTRHEVLEWRGDGYDAIVLIDKYGDEEDEDEICLQTVCRLTYFAYLDGQTAEPNELTTANTLLQEYTRAILFAQQTRKPNECGFSWARARYRSFQSSLQITVISLFEKCMIDENGPSDLSILAEEEFLQRREEAMVYPDPVGLDIDVSH